MFNFLKNSTVFFRSDKNIDTNKGVTTKPLVRKINNRGTGSYAINIPPVVISSIIENCNTEYMQLEIKSLKQIAIEALQQDNDELIIVLKPYIDDNKKE